MDKQKILIVDHEPRITSALVGFLSHEPYDVFTAQSGREGLKILRQEEIDLAVVEIQIEDMDGITLLKCAKAEKIQTDILIMTRGGTIDIPHPCGDDDVDKVSVSYDFDDNELTAEIDCGDG